MARLFLSILFLWAGLIWAQAPGASLADSYALNAGDAVRIHVYGEEDLSFDQLLIGQNGRISYPFLGELTVTGKTASQLQAEITAGLKPDYLVDPRVSVSVVKYRPFFVNGDAFEKLTSANVAVLARLNGCRRIELDCLLFISEVRFKHLLQRIRSHRRFRQSQLWIALQEQNAYQILL